MTAHHSLAECRSVTITLPPGIKNDHESIGNNAEVLIAAMGLCRREGVSVTDGRIERTDTGLCVTVRLGRRITADVRNAIAERITEYLVRLTARPVRANTPSIE